MTTGGWIANVVTLGMFLIAALVLFRDWWNDRKKPAINEATITQMADERHRARDFRNWQLEGFVDLEREWRRKIAVWIETKIEQWRRGEPAPPELDYPPPPEIPAPPHA